MFENSHLVNCEWLKDNLEHPKLVLLFSQMDNPVSG